MISRQWRRRMPIWKTAMRITFLSTKNSIRRWRKAKIGLRSWHLRSKLSRMSQWWFRRSSCQRTRQLLMSIDASMPRAVPKAAALCQRWASAVAGLATQLTMTTFLAVMFQVSWSSQTRSCTTGTSQTSDKIQMRLSLLSSLFLSCLSTCTEILIIASILWGFGVLGFWGFGVLGFW